MMRLSLVLLSALAYAALFPPWELSWLAWVALVPFLVVLRGCTWPQRLWLGATWGIVSNFAVGFWVPGAIDFYYDRPWWFGPLFCAVASLVFWTPYYAAFAVLVEPARRGLRVVVQPLVIAALWVTAELARATLMTGAPWLPLGYALAPHALLIQLADCGGVYILSFVVLASNAAVAEVLYRRHRARHHGSARSLSWTPLATAAVVVIVSIAYGNWRLATPLPDAASVPVRLVQGNNQEGAYWRPGAYGKGFEDYLRLSQSIAAARPPELLIWPEAAVTMFFGHEPHYQQRIDAMLQTMQAGLLLGAPHYENPDPALPAFLNSAFYLEPQRGITGRYDKTHLLPFVEYFPLRIDFLRRRFERVRNFTPGTDSVLLDTRLGPTAVVICFEGIFPGLVRDLMARGAQALVVLSNDVWLGRGAGPEQHLAMIRLRAVENRTWVLRSTTTGVSAIIDPFGRVVQRSRTFEAAVLDAAVVPLRITTPYERYGDAFAWSCLLMTLACGSRAWARRIR